MPTVQKLWNCLFQWHIPPASEDELKTAHAIVTQAYSRLKDNSPGPGNRVLASVTRKLWERHRLPILPQEEIAMADQTLPIHTRIGASPDGLSTMQWNTYAVAKWQARVCLSNDWKRVIVVAFSWHMGRACAVYRKVGLIPLPAAMPAEAEEKQCFHPESRDWTLRTPLRAKPRELACRLLFLYKGWI